MRVHVNFFLFVDFATNSFHDGVAAAVVADMAPRRHTCAAPQYPAPAGDASRAKATTANAALANFALIAHASLRLSRNSSVEIDGLVKTGSLPSLIDSEVTALLP